MKLYIDTSVFGGYFDQEFEIPTKKLFKEIFNFHHSLIISNITLRELEKSPENVKTLSVKVLKLGVELIDIDNEVESLALNYIKEKIISEKYLLDAYHIAAGTINRVDVLVSWNFKHMVNLLKIKSYNSVNLKYGYGLIDIRSPLELVNETD
ncbi:MAG: PIN domain-containing protein [Ignavibacteriae bacterium]|nr:PIN domain-containing protein [Ignavibacteriota bacterium]